MKNHSSLHTHEQWVQTLTTGCQTDGLFRISPELAMQLIPGEIHEMRRDLKLCRQRQAEIIDEVVRISRRRREAPEVAVLRRRLERQKERQKSLQGTISRLAQGMRSLVQTGKFLPPARLPQPRESARRESDWSLPRGMWRAA